MRAVLCGSESVHLAVGSSDVASAYVDAYMDAVLKATSKPVAIGGSFESFRAFELAHDTTARERKGLIRGDRNCLS